jgi:diguanylate cyclase (GGDEF)-like protein/PAS domain S-box-containing protein
VGLDPDISMAKKGKRTAQSEKIEQSVRERRTVELQFRESEHYYRELLEHLPVGVYRTTPSGNIIEANRMLAEILGYERPEDLHDVDVNSLYVQKSDREDHLKKLDASLTYFTEFELRRRDGRIISVRDFPRAVLAPDGTVAYYTGALFDVTEQRETQKKLHRALVDLENSNRERQTVIAELENLSLLDDLTKLYNRRGFMAEAQQSLREAQKSGRRVFFLFMDLDNLKWINDSWGHQKGDEALIQFAEILRKALRGTDIKGRLGGDEFAVLALETEDFSPEVLIERLQERVREFNSGRQYPFSLSISMGTSYFDPHHPSSIEELLVRADKLMYEQKRSKHNP